MKLAEFKADATNYFKQRLDHDLQLHASMAHKTVSGKYASQPVIPPVICLRGLAAQATGWNHISNIWQRDLSEPPSFAVEGVQLSSSQLDRLFKETPVAGISLSRFVGRSLWDGVGF